MNVAGASNVGKRIASARRAAGMSQAQVAKALGVSAPAVTQWERGKTDPSAQNLKALSELLRVPPDFLWSGAASVSTPSPMLDVRLVDEPPPEIAAMLRGRKVTLYQMMGHTMMAAGYTPGDYLVTDPLQAPKARDTVIVQSGQRALCRLWFPPYAIAAPLTGAEPNIIVDNHKSVIVGVVTSRIASS